jgi:tetratricopeptide (TPR) repeat protein
MTQGQKKINRSLVCLTALGLLSIKASAQMSIPNLPENKLLLIAEEQYNQKQYANAVQSARIYLQHEHDNVRRKTIDEREKAAYYLTASGLRVNEAGFDDSAKAFIRQTANPAYKQRMAFTLAQHYFKKNELANAIPYYEMAGIGNLSNAEIIDAKFELAYSYFNSKRFDKAETLFASIKEIPGKYNIAGNYYYGLLAYNKGEFDKALRSFERVKNEPEYKSIIPYYIAEIHYFTGDKKKALDDALELIKNSERSFYYNELHLLAAQVLFEEGRYGDALPYFEYYYQNSESIRKEDVYEMGYSYYRVNEWNNAINKFKLLSNTEDSLGQTAMYLLGDCYLKVGDKRSARNAFMMCSDLSFNDAQREAALLLSARLSYELGYNNDAITQVNTLLEQYPGSQYKDEAKTVLSDLLIKTSNYEAAYNNLKDVRKGDNYKRQVYQKVSYGYAMQQLQNGSIIMADELLTESLKNAVDEGYEAAANFWKADIAYRQQRYNDAISYGQKFVSGNNRQGRRISATATQANAYLNMGYAALALEDFAGAQGYFAKAQDADNTTTSNDALVRQADAMYMQQKYAQALPLYEKAIAANNAYSEYARFQKAIVLGLTGKQNEKFNILQSLINSVPPSAYSYDARYEMAQYYLEQNKYQQAIDVLMPLTTAAERRNMAPKALVKIAYAYQQMGNTSKAIDAYRKIVTNYTTSEERQTALDALKSLYIENNQPAAYAQLLRDMNLSPTDNSSLDSTYYAAAEAQFAAGKWEAAKQSLKQYIQQYPTGIFITKAHYYKAESHIKLKENASALEEYKAVLQSQWSEYTESSARKAAALAMEAKSYEAANTYYAMLRNTAMDQSNLQIAYNGLVITSYNLNRTGDVIAYADTLLSIPDVNEQTRNETLLYKAKALQQQNSDNRAEALAIYRQITPNASTAIGDEARYRIAEILYQQDKLKEAEDAANAAIKMAGSNEYWVVKTYILLSDILVKQKDYFNAKATLQSIVKNAKNADLKQEATKKLNEVIALEKKQSKLSD